MAKKIEEEKSSKVKTKEFTLRGNFQGLARGEKVKVGPRGERFLKSKNLI